MDSKKKATTVVEQIEKLKSRGMIIEDEEKAKEYLLDIGYFRLGFYWFPFEKTYPRKKNRNHIMKDNTNLDYVIKLYYFDFDLRNLFLRYISRIEINFRTKLIYYVSNFYKADPYWYVSSAVIKEKLLTDKEYKKQLSELSREDVVRIDRQHHDGCKYSPAWKAIEFMSFGMIIRLYENLKSNHLLCDIAKVYDFNHPSQFIDYLNALRRLRNYCAHGKVLFDLDLSQAIGGGPLGNLGNNKTNLAGVYFVLKYLLEKISRNRVVELQASMLEIFEKVPYTVLRDIISNCSGLKKDNL